jgi:hypothetical protein
MITASISMVEESLTRSTRELHLCFNSDSSVACIQAVATLTSASCGIAAAWMEGFACNDDDDDDAADTPSIGAGTANAGVGAATADVCTVDGDAGAADDGSGTAARGGANVIVEGGDTADKDNDLVSVGAKGASTGTGAKSENVSTTVIPCALANSKMAPCSGLEAKFRKVLIPSCCRNSRLNLVNGSSARYKPRSTTA